jgi:hypothetical protein
MPLPAYPNEEQVLFANGDCLAGTPLHVSGGRLRFRLPGEEGPELDLSLTTLAVIWFATPQGPDDAEAWRRRLRAQPRGRDLLLLRNGDTAQGTLAALTDTAVRLETAAGDTIEVERGKVAAVALNTELVRRPRPRRAYGRLVLTDGSRLALASAQSSDRLLTGKTLYGVAVAFPLEAVAALDVYQGCAVYLSDLKPRQYTHRPYLGAGWPFVPDGSVAGRDLRVGGGIHDKGVGLHSESRLTYDLRGGYRWFEVLVGLDDRTGQGGSARIGVLVDGKPCDLGGPDELTGQTPPRALRIPVKGAKELTLVVEFGKRGDVQDHVNWADARLIR